MMYPVQLVDIFSDTFRPLIESAINVSTELDEFVAGHAIKGYITLLCLTGLDMLLMSTAV